MKILNKDEITYDNLEKDLDLESKKINNILIFGIGGSGINTLNSLNLGKTSKNIELLVASNNPNKLEKSDLKNKIFFGRRKNGEIAKMIAGFDPSVGKILAEENAEEIEKYLKNIDLMIVVGGMSGGTATGAIPVIINKAKELNMATVAIVTTPFSTEGSIRKELAKEGTDKVKANADIAIIYDSEDLNEVLKQKTEHKNILLELDLLICEIIEKIVGLLN